MQTYRVLAGFILYNAAWSESPSTKPDPSNPDTYMDRSQLASLRIRQSMFSQQIDCSFTLRDVNWTVYKLSTSTRTRLLVLLKAGWPSKVQLRKSISQIAGCMSICTGFNMSKSMARNIIEHRIHVLRDTD